MASKTLKTRILLKTDTTANWEKAANSFIPKEGEVCIYSDRFQLEDGTYVPGIKVGDGSSYINELEFMGDEYISNEEIDEILGSTGGGGGTSTIQTYRLTFPSELNREDLGITSTNSRLSFNYLDGSGSLILFVNNIQNSYTNASIYGLYQNWIGASLGSHVASGLTLNLPRNGILVDHGNWINSVCTYDRNLIKIDNKTYLIRGDCVLSYQSNAPA